jgi:hypothetical protein
MGLICWPETSVRNCHYSLHNTEERSSHVKCLSALYWLSVQDCRFFIIRSLFVKWSVGILWWWRKTSILSKPWNSGSKEEPWNWIGWREEWGLAQRILMRGDAERARFWDGVRTRAFAVCFSAKVTSSSFKFRRTFSYAYFSEHTVVNLLKLYYPNLV